jgi:signal transduction histidine kinase
MPVDLNTKIEIVLALLKTDLQSAGVRVETRLDDTLPAVPGDRVQLQQVIFNMVANARDAMRNVEPRLLKIGTSQTPSGMVRISIEDTGIGISAADRERIFDPLFTTKSSGMGMGLSICRSIIENHGGKILVLAAAERGTIFQIELPKAEVSEALDQQAA